MLQCKIFVCILNSDKTGNCPAFQESQLKLAKNSLPQRQENIHARLEPVQKVNAVTAEAFERIALKSYNIMGDIARQKPLPNQR